METGSLFFWAIISHALSHSFLFGFSKDTNPIARCKKSLEELAMVTNPCSTTSTYIGAVKRPYL